MSSQRRNFSEQAKLLKSVEDFENALVSMQRALETLDTEHKRALSTSRQIHALTRSEAAKSPSPGLKMEITRLQARISRSQNVIDKAYKSFTTAQTKFSGNVEGFKSAHSYHNDHLSRLQGRTAAQSRQNSALFNVVNGLMNRLFAATVDPDALPDSYSDVPDGSFGYIPHDPKGFLAMLLDVDACLSIDPDYADDGHRYRPVNFVEVGCSTGRLLQMAMASRVLLYDRACGFDINADQIAAGRQMFGDAFDIFVDDAMSFDYSGFDVIYAYRPFQDAELQAQFEAHLVATMPVGGYLMVPLNLTLDEAPQMEPMGATSSVWRKMA
jgi:hypothetical protein